MPKFKIFCTGNNDKMKDKNPFGIYRFQWFQQKWPVSNIDQTQSNDIKMQPETKIELLGVIISTTVVGSQCSDGSDQFSTLLKFNPLAYRNLRIFTTLVGDNGMDKPVPVVLEEATNS